MLKSVQIQFGVTVMLPPSRKSSDNSKGYSDNKRLL